AAHHAAARRHGATGDFGARGTGELGQGRVAGSATMPVTAFLHYALEVPDQTVGQKFYQDFGLVDATGRSNAVRLKASRQDREGVQLYAGPRKRLHHLCYGATGEDFAEVRASLRRANVPDVDAPRNAPDGGIWVRDPDGTLVNIREESPPAAPAEPPPQLNGPGYAPRQAVRGYPARSISIAPRRLGHALLFTADLNRQIDFYTRVLGMKLS